MKKKREVAEALSWRKMEGSKKREERIMAPTRLTFFSSNYREFHEKQIPLLLVL